MNEHLGAKISEALHNKKWGDCIDAEKIERLRRELISLRWMVNEARWRGVQFENHDHAPDGRVVVPVRGGYSAGEVSARDSLE